jgi:hypothetical protein
MRKMLLGNLAEGRPAFDCPRRSIRLTETTLLKDWSAMLDADLCSVLQSVISKRKFRIDTRSQPVDRSIRTAGR